MNSVQLQEKLKQDLQRIAPRMAQPDVTNLALWSQALALSPDCHLANLALEMPVTGARENLIQRARRSLSGQPFVTLRAAICMASRLCSLRAPLAGKLEGRRDRLGDGSHGFGPGT